MKIAAITPRIRLGDCKFNTEQVIAAARSSADKGCHLAIFPMSVLFGNTIGPLTISETVQMSIHDSIELIRKETSGLKDLTIVLSMEILKKDSEGEFDIAFFVINGGTCGLFYEWDNPEIEVCGKKISLIVGEPFANDSNDIIVCLSTYSLTGACTASALAELKEHSLKNEFILISGCFGESVDEDVISTLKAYARKGEICDYSLKEGMCIFDTDDEYKPLNVIMPEYSHINFLPDEGPGRDAFLLNVLRIQAVGLGERLVFLGTDKSVLGLSGGLDSTLALVAAVNAYEKYGLDKKNIICVTMPGFGTGSVTKNNAHRLAEAFGVTLLEIDIKDQVDVHLKSIGQPMENGRYVPDVTFENAQARVRTMILMDIANKENGIVIGTGDMSELALGWCTYNGDHMSNFSVNAGVSKTMIAPLLRLYVRRIADPKERPLLNEIFESIIETPVSPELLPTDDNGEVVQKTQDVIGPYELHDFFLCLFFNGCSANTIFNLALEEFKNRYDKETIKDTLKIFIKRIFTQQFKRSCMPVGPRVTTYSLSPRSGLLFPSDMYADEWLRNLD